MGEEKGLEKQDRNRLQGNRPNFGVMNVASRSSGSSSGKKRDSDKDSGIQANEVKVHDDGRVTLERDRLYQHENHRSAAALDERPPLKKKMSTSSGDSGLHTLPQGKTLPNDAMLANLENDDAARSPTFNEVVTQRSPVGRLPSQGSVKEYGNSPISRPPANGSTSSSVRSSGRAPVSVPLEKAPGPSLVNPARYKVPPPLPASAPPPPTSSDEEEMSPGDSDAKYDGVYYTREPLNNKPATDFPRKPLEVDIDPKSYRPHGNKPSQL